MHLSDATLAKISDMNDHGGRTVDGRWRSVTNDITCNCKNGEHDRCGGWIFPIGGKRECNCPCHDDHRPPYREALATFVKAADWWRINTFVTVDGSDEPWWRITFVDNRAGTVTLAGPDDQTRVAPFAALNLHPN
jgi:hypothetical protein